MSGGIGQARIAANYKLEWERARGFQGNEVASIERYTETGGDDAAGIEPTRTQVSGISDLAVVVDDFTEDIAKSLGQDWQSGRKVFRFMPDATKEKVLDSDYILWTKQSETTQTRWKPESIQIHNIDSSYSICIVVASRAPRP